MHVMCGTSTHIVTSVELSRARSHDSPYYKPLVDATAKSGFNMLEVSADKAYISADNLKATVDRGATPYILSRRMLQARATIFGRSLSTSTTSSAKSF